MRPFALSLVVVGLVLQCAVAHSATTIHVPADQPTIQAGVNAADYGDTVLLAAGVYRGDGNRDVIIGSKRLVIAGEEGPGCTLIDLEGSSASPHRAFHFNAFVSRMATIEGLTIINGYSDGWGGAILIDNATPTIKNCRFIRNTAPLTHSGGAIAGRVNSGPLITQCVFFENRAIPQGGGGAIFLNSLFRTFEVSYCTFVRNEAQVGGAIAISESPGSISQCTFLSNSALYQGSAVSAYSMGPVGNVPFTHNLVAFNIHTFRDGTGAPVKTVDSGQFVLECCDVYGNDRGDWIGELSGQDTLRHNQWADPMFCDVTSPWGTIDPASPCSPSSPDNPCGELIGAADPTCVVTGDEDGDGIGDCVDDCPTVNNPGQEDLDLDGIGDVCDFCPTDPLNDSDADGICYHADNCPTSYNPSQIDSDADGIGDVCDDCPTVFEQSQLDTDSDGVGDACDNCIDVPNSSQWDGNQNGIGDACECLCSCLGDPALSNGGCDGRYDVGDVIEVVAVTFRSVTPWPTPIYATCPFEMTDVDCSGFTNIVDVVRIINVAFRNANPATEFCAPCEVPQVIASRDSIHYFCYPFIATDTFTLANTGTVAASFSLTTAADWLSFDPASGSIPPASTLFVTATAFCTPPPSNQTWVFVRSRGVVTDSIYTSKEELPLDGPR